MAETKSGKRNGVGVLLYGCDSMRESNEQRLPTTHQLMELSPPGIEQVRSIQSCRVDDLKEFLSEKDERGEQDRAHLFKSALYEANKTFAHAQ